MPISGSFTFISQNNLMMKLIRRRNMIKYLLPSLLLLSAPVMAESFKTSIFAIEEASDGGEPLVKFTNGRVAFINDNNTLKKVKSLPKQAWLYISTDSEGYLQSLKITTGKELMLETSHEVENSVPESFTPTVLKSKSEAIEIFERLNDSYQRQSQCFNRAHVWAYEEFKYNNITSNKTFVFFSSPYIKKHRFVWWFHVAPMMPVKDGSTTKNMVFDVRYSFGPSSIKEWTDLFVYTKKECRKFEKYSEMDRQSEKEDCWVTNTSMYFWHPYNIERLETHGTRPDSFSESEIKSAYREAF
jgi:hypothetical protein